MTSSNFLTLFVGSYTSKEQPGIYTVQFHTLSGELSLKQSYVGVENPSFLTVHPNGRFLYAVSEIGKSSHGEHGSVWAFAINPLTYALEKINQQSTEGAYPCHVILDQNGRFLIATNYGTGNTVFFPIMPDGSLGKRVTLLQHSGSGPNPDRQEGPHAHSAIFTPDNRFVIVADLGIDRLAMYQFDGESGAVQKYQDVKVNPGSGPRHMVFHPNGRFLYVANELDSTVTLFNFDATSGSLKPIETVSTLTQPNPDSFVADIHIFPDGSHLTVSNRGDNSLAVFKISQNGDLSRLGTPSCGGNWPRNFALAENGRFALVANRRSNHVSVLELANGTVKPMEGHSLHEPSCIQFLNAKT